MKVLNLQAKMRQKRKYSSHKGDVGKKQRISFKANLKALKQWKSATQM
ncbi:putative transposase [Streptococcus pneumoniae GA17328]|nr:putative transposase [Streptococcus pneumoniae GA17328]